MYWIAEHCHRLEAEFAMEKLGFERFYRDVSSRGRLRIRSRWVFNFICILQVILSIYFAYFIQSKI